MPNEKFKKLKELEEKISSLSEIHPNVNVYIFYVGLLYGEVQIDLKKYFKSAFL